jgi:hypothetical protein
MQNTASSNVQVTNPTKADITPMSSVILVIEFLQSLMESALTFHAGHFVIPKIHF